jgi:hypothetical protein
MCHPQLRWSLLLMGHHEGNALKYQVKQERLRVLPLNPMESGKMSTLFPISFSHHLVFTKNDEDPPCSDVV